MRWQDIVIAIAQVGFIIALLPSVRSREKPALPTSVTYTVLVAIVGACQLTLHLWFSAATAWAGGVEWLILAVQRFRLDRT